MSRRLRLAFLGTPAAAVPTFARMVASHDVVAAITRPDRPRGRSGRPVPSPVAEAAAGLGIPVLQPERGRRLTEMVVGLAPLDAAIVVAFGMLVRPDALEVPALGFLNVHFSLLPRWRGATPVEHALLAGDRWTGVSVMRMDEGLDTGPVLGVRSLAIRGDDTTGSVTTELSHRGADLMAEVLGGLSRGRALAVPQPAGGATLAPRLGPADAEIDWHLPAGDVERLVRAMSPKPVAWTRWADARFHVHRVAADPAAAPLDPGELDLAGGVLRCGTGSVPVALEIVQPEGRRPMPGADWARGRHGDLGRFG